jgi:predicted aconitase
MKEATQLTELLLTESDRALLNGDAGPGTALAMLVVTEMAVAMGANRLLDISAAHIDGCLYHGRAGLDFALRLVQGGARTVVPATLNVASLDLLHPELYRGDPDTAAAARRLMDAYTSMGCIPTWTCAPYQLPDRPRLGQQIAWAESNAIVFANSVLGARTNRYGDFLDISCAITGRAPATGLHLDQGRIATWVAILQGLEEWLDSDWLYPVLGYELGRIDPVGVPAIVGLGPGVSEDRLKALGAGAASTGAIAMFHAVGVTPEATTLGEATGNRRLEEVVIDRERIHNARRRLSHGVTGPVSAVSLGAPHYSAAELIRLAEWLRGRSLALPLYVNTHREAMAAAVTAVSILEQTGVTIVTDTCTYITPILVPGTSVVMTDSAKWAYYAPGNLGLGVVFGSPAECVAVALGES